MKLLVTGAAGFIGSNFAHYWVKNYPNDKVRIIDALTYAGNFENLRSIENKIEFTKADINDRAMVSQSLKGIDAIVHFAAESHVDRSIFDPASYWHTNVHGTRVLLEEAKKAGVKRFHHISTDEVYGELPLGSDMKFTENTPYAPRQDNLYALSKAEADWVVQDFCNESPEMYITISNCSNNYGPFQFPEKFIPIIVTNLIDEIDIPLHGDGRNVRDWIHALDHSSAIDAILRNGKKGEKYLVGTNNDRSNGEIAKKVVNLYGKDESVIHHVSDRHSNDRRYAIDASKLVNELGWKPQIPRNDFEDGLKETIKWYKDNQDWWRPLLLRKAEISDSSGRVKAYISLNRTSGKTDFKFEELQTASKDVSSQPAKDFLEEYKIRRNIVLKNLEAKKWFQGSKDEIKDHVISLSKEPSTFGFVEDLSQREDQQGGSILVSLSKIEHANSKFGIYGIAAWFEVLSRENKKQMQGYYSWGWGPKSGAKLLVFIKTGNEISHLVIQREEKFPTAAIEYSLAGGFPKVNEGVLDFIIRSLKKDLDIDILDTDVQIDQIKSLGKINPDAGMTNNKPNIYTIIIKMKEIPKEKLEDAGEGVVFWSIEKLSDLINKSDDAYFLSALTRLRLAGDFHLDF